MYFGWGLGGAMVALLTHCWMRMPIFASSYLSFPSFYLLFLVSYPLFPASFRLFLKCVNWRFSKIYFSPNCFKTFFASASCFLIMSMA